MIVKEPEGQLPLAPEGTFAAVCVDEVDLGEVTTSFNGNPNTRRMVRLVWQLTELDKQNQPYFVRKDYTASLHEKAGLRKTLEQWRGKAFTVDELRGFDLENVVGVGCLVSVVHNTGSKGGLFANVAGVMRLPKGMTAPLADGYLRSKDRPIAPQTLPPAQSVVQPEPPPNFGGLTDDDVPF